MSGLNTEPNKYTCLLQLIINAKHKLTKQQIHIASPPRPAQSTHTGTTTQKTHLTKVSRITHKHIKAANSSGPQPANVHRSIQTNTVNTKTPTIIQYNLYANIPQNVLIISLILHKEATQSADKGTIILPPIKANIKQQQRIYMHQLRQLQHPNQLVNKYRIKLIHQQSNTTCKPEIKTHQPSCYYNPQAKYNLNHTHVYKHHKHLKLTSNKQVHNYYTNKLNYPSILCPRKRPSPVQHHECKVAQINTASDLNK
eukprot:gene3096-2078_t